MILTAARIFSLMLLLVIITASQTTLFAETESSPLVENTNLTDSNNDTDSDNVESLLFNAPVIDTRSSNIFQNSVPQYTAELFLSTAFPIRASPPYIYL